MRVKHRIEYGLLRSVIFVFNLLPVKAILFFCTALGYFAWVVFPFRLRVAYKNLSTVFPDASHRHKMRILRTVYLQNTRTFGLVFILHRKKMRAIIENTKVTGLEKLQDGLAQGKGVILTTLHASWFEAYFAWFNMAKIPTGLIYQKQSNPLSDQYFVSQRQKYGDSVDHLSSYDGMKCYQNALDEGRALIISLDQSYTDRGIGIQFFNRELSCAKGTAILHLRTQAPVLTSVYYMKDGIFHIDIDTVDLPEYETIDDESMRDISRRAIKGYEPFIREYPEQWFSLFHRLWSKKEYDPVERSLRDIFL